MLTRLPVTAAALLALAALSGCGSTAETAAPPSAGATATKDKKHQLEAVKADCMKQKGFKYVAFVYQDPPETEESKKRSSGDYQEMRKFREKYGFGVFREFVYPQESKSENATPETNPNGKIQGSLSKAQFKAYEKAMTVCEATSYKHVLGLDVKSEMDYLGQGKKARDRALKSGLNADPQLVELASAMATCLKGKGYTIGDTTPVALSDRGWREFFAQMDKLGRAQRDDVPDVAPPVKEGEIAMSYWPTLTPQQARPYLDKEIKAALDDIECGKDFYPAYKPKESAIQQKVNEQFGM
ncbi:hypothetical protein [Nonomuraea helvata]|uniref:Lipoprotein n=1 Tax=Nonomuraea helvata TaxID=37484 RepID=A0ABV5S4M7_9ACTN